MNQPSTTPGSLEYFRLRPLKAVKVSDISETTANAPVPAEKKVNFHIGHPVYDSRLLDIYASLVSGLPKNVRHQNGDALRGSLENTLWEETDESTLRLLYEAMEQSVQYIPRGGYSGKKPNRLAELVRGWLEDHQREGLDYGLGGESEPREIVFSAGGQQENMRVLFHALSRTLIQTPAYIFAHGNTIPKHLTSFDNLVFPQTPADELKLLDTLSAHFNSLPESPHFLVLFRIHSESVRRELRRMSLDYPLFFIEMNDALNHHSLAREAGMLNQVLRFISPSAIHSSITADSLNIVAGYAEFVKLFETIHFQLKGTPSGAEIVLLTTQIERAFSGDSGGPESEENSQKQVADPSSITEFEYTAEVAERFGSRIQDIVESRAAKAESLVERLADTSDRLGRSVLPEDAGISDPLMGMDRHEIVEKYVHGNPGFSAGEITESLLSQFLRHHPEYESESAAVVSGSARTALSLLGFHCGIREAVVPDLSWTYEHCFPSVEAVSLGENLTLDARAIIDHIRGKLEADPEWREYGAFVLNNPHNASGRVFESSEVKLLLRWLLSHDITVIDDLAYENLGPMESLNGPPTMRALAKDLKRSGHIRASQLRNLITVHSLSKTDCFAGARLAVAHIPDKEILARFSTMNAGIVPNTFAVLIASLFYRNHEEDIRQFWQMRNTILHDRLQALLDAHEALPEERNPFGIRIRAPQGAMYPHLTIDELPAGISLDWLGIGLATRGIGLVPLTTFARTSEGFDLARKSFRLTLGGADPAEELRHKARRVLIDLNRLISEEAANYSREPLPPPVRKSPGSNHFDHAANRWNELSARLATLSKEKIAGELRKFSREIDTERYAAIFSRSHLPERLETLTTQFKDRMEMAQSLVSQTTSRNKESVLKQLERELIPTSLDSKEENFRNRMFDRTVHPTQMNSLKVDILANKLFQSLLNGERIPEHRPDEISDELIEEYLGTNVPLLSREEMSELVNDLRMMVGTEEYARLRYNLDMPLLLSFWGDWDGSTRPSGQGHRLAAAALLENVSQLSGILQSLSERDKTIEISTELLDDIRRLDASKREFWDLLNEITSLTNQLEKRYQQVLPFGVQPGKLRKLGMRLRLARDPVRALWQHNDRLERKMRKLRDQRRENLEYYFALNQRLRKTLRKNLDVLEQHLEDPAVALKAGTYRDILKRFVLTPRIHQKMILAQDQFAIDATVHNITEINEIAGKYGHPGLVMALQISMSDEPEAFISLERKLRSRRDEVLRDNPGLDLPRIKVVPLFEDVDTVHNLESYLDSVWDYAGHSRKLDQSQIQRFSEMVCELFVAGSDLSQQMSQLAGAELYKEAKHRAMRWLTNHGLVGNIRMKLGSGEPMQRQGGYFDGNAGLPSTEISRPDALQLKRNLSEAGRRSLAYARSPLRGVWAGGEFRTFQSNVFERLRSLTNNQRIELFHHVTKSQQSYEEKLARASEPLVNTRLEFKERGAQDLEMLTRGHQNPVYEELTDLMTNNFRQILYGRPEDVVGIHVISYFIARTTPSLRDRPVVRPSRDSDENVGQQIVQKIAQTLPLSQHGSLLRAIGHNRSQTMVLGINQLTTGLFRALREFQDSRTSDNEGLAQIRKHILPQLPVYDILHTLRIYQDTELKYIGQMEPLFPASNSAFSALHEDYAAMQQYIRPLQKELLRRQGLDPDEFFTGNGFNLELLQFFRPDLAVLLQPDLFNTSLESLIPKRKSAGRSNGKWQVHMEDLLRMPGRIREWRAKTWNLVGEPIREQVERFVELAHAIQTLTQHEDAGGSRFTSDPTQAVRLGSQVTDLLKNVQDDSMRQFLHTVVQYLTQIPENVSEVPVDVIRALRDVERLVKIEEQALDQEEQTLLRFYLLQMARLAGENG